MRSRRAYRRRHRPNPLALTGVRQRVVGKQAEQGPPHWNSLADGAQVQHRLVYRFFLMLGVPQMAWLNGQPAIRCGLQGILQHVKIPRDCAVLQQVDWRSRFDKQWT